MKEAKERFAPGGAFTFQTEGMKCMKADGCTHAYLTLSILLKDVPLSFMSIVK